MSNKNLYAALLKAQQSVQPVSKDGNNKFMGYRYATAEDMVAQAKLALNNAGLVLTLVRKTVRESANGGTELFQELVLAHPDSGEAMELNTAMAVVIDKGKVADKAEAATATFDLGYFVKSMLLMIREDATTSIDARDDTKAPDQKAVIADLKTAIEAAKSRDEVRKIGAKATELGLTGSIKGEYTAKYKSFAEAS